MANRKPEIQENIMSAEKRQETIISLLSYKEFLMDKIRPTLEEIKSIEHSIKEIQKICRHKFDDGTTALKFLNSDSHRHYYRCHICGIDLEE
jgi:hypothetical protein